jgi:hypothetical protein
MIYMGYKFRAPAANDTDEWRRIECALKDGRDYGVPTVRKQQPKPKLSPKLRIALGIYGKRRAKKQANKRGAGKGGIPSVLHTGHARPALPDHERSL